MIKLGPDIVPENARVKINVDAGTFELILRPVTEDERMTDQGLRDRYWQEEDPALVIRFNRARGVALLDLIVGWDGVTAEVEGKEQPVQFSKDNLRRLLNVDGVGIAVSNVLIDHFNNGGAGRRKKGESDSTPGGSSAADGSTATKSPGSSVGTQGDSEPANLQAG